MNSFLLNRVLIRRCFIVVIGFCAMIHMSMAVSIPRLLVEKNLPLGLAHKIANKTLAACRRDGYRVSVAVVDRAGVLKVLLRDNGAGPHTTDSSMRKAYTAASLKESTSQLAEIIVNVPTAIGLRDMNEKILILGGGLPIKVEGDVIGGVGVGGAPGGHLDEACAAVGLEIAIEGG